MLERDSSQGNVSADLMRRSQAGDAAALDALIRRYLPALSRWARGRLPTWARDIRNTDDIVQDVFIRTLSHVQDFEFRHAGAMTAYLRQCVLHRIRDEIRHARRRPGHGDLNSGIPAGTASPYQEAEAAALLEDYEAALGRLSEDDREAIVARVELRIPYREIAGMLGKPSTEAARMAVKRALVRLARELGRK